MRYALSMVLTVLLFVGTALGAGTHVVTLKETVGVSGEKVLLKDIAAITGRDAASLSSMFIMKSPSGPIGAKLSADYVARRIAGEFKGPFVMKGAQKVHITRKYVTVSKKRLEKIFSSTVYAKSPWKKKGKIVIEDIKGSHSVEVLEKDKNAIQAKISPHEDFLGRTSMTLVIGKGSSSGKVRLSAKVKVFADIPVVKETIDRGAMITKAALEVKSVDVSAYPSAVMDEKECVGKRAKTRLRQGRPLLKTNIENPPLISRGDIVFIQAKSDSFIIQDKGLALKDGHLTERIPVRNVTSGKQVVGTIIAASCIEVYF